MMSTIASLLGTKPADLEKALCYRVVGNRLGAVEKMHTQEQAEYGRDAFAKVRGREGGREREEREGERRRGERGRERGREEGGEREGEREGEEEGEGERGREEGGEREEVRSEKTYIVRSFNLNLFGVCGCLCYYLW